MFVIDSPGCDPKDLLKIVKGPDFPTGGIIRGMEGIKNKYPLPAPIEEDVYEMSAKRRKELNIGALPGSLYEAIEAAETSPLIRDTLGDHVFEKLLENKRIEWDKFRVHVSRYEIENYLPIL